MGVDYTLKKVKISQIITIQVVLFALLFAFSFYQVLGWNLFPWLNLSIIFGSSFLSLIYSVVVKIQLRIIKILILTTASIQLIINSIFLSQHEMLRAHWNWMFFPLAIVFSIIFWDLFSRKTNQVNFLGRIACIILLILTFFKFLNSFIWLDYSLVILVSMITLALLFTKSSRSLEEI